MERDGIFVGDDPFVIARRWLDTARESEPNDPDAAAVATVDANGMPNVRMVLVRRFDPDSFVFFTNYQSSKGQEILGSGKAALNFHWKSLRRQLRVRGNVIQEQGEVADEYYAQRHPQSRIGAWASKQSQPLENRAVLMEEVNRVRMEQGEEPPRPPFWGGFRLFPTDIEFWSDGDHRLHDRFHWHRSDPEADWVVRRLNP